MSTQEKNTVKDISANLKADQTGLEVLSLEGIGLEDTFGNVKEEYALWVRALLQNWRQGTVGCKARSDVAYTNKKPWKQKGTGRARAGSARSPLWRGGGVTFGPQARVKTLKLNKKSKGRVLSTLVAEYVKKSMLFSLDWTAGEDKPSTSIAHKAFKSHGFSDKKTTLFLSRDDVNNWMSVRNMSNIQVLAFDDVNAYELSLGNCIVVLKKDFDMFKDMVKRWN